MNNSMDDAGCCLLSVAWNIAPRTGFAWNITGDGRNVVHGGAGLFFEPILSNIYRAYGNRTPPFYNAINPSNPPFPNPPTSGSSSLLRLDLVDYNLKNPYRMQYNVSFQRELWGRTTATVGYIGARGHHHVIDQTESHGCVAQRMVSRRPNRREGGATFRLTLPEAARTAPA